MVMKRCGNWAAKGLSTMMALVLASGLAVGAVAAQPLVRGDSHEGGSVAYAATKGSWQYSRAKHAWWYLFDNGTYPTSGSLRIGGSTYFFDRNGWMRTGWIKSGGRWYYCDSSGAMATGWRKVGKTWYYLHPTYGSMVTGWQRVGNAWYYFNSSGAMKTGWLKSGAQWYYLNPSGAMATEWKKISGEWYYFLPGSGVMATNRYIGSYWVNGDGVWEVTKIDARELLDLVNQARARIGVAPLQWSDSLTDTALVRARESSTPGNFSHTRPNGSSCFTAYPGGLTEAGENLAAGPTSAAKVHNGWMRSAGHRKNVLSPEYNVMGAACVSVDDAYHYYWTESFGYDPNA